MSDDDKGKGFNPLSGMPPWAWVLLLGSGSGIGLGGLSLVEQEEQECPGENEVVVAVARAEAAEASHRAMIDSLQNMALLLGECQTNRNEHGIDIR
jgi:hypothetical protein